MKDSAIKHRTYFLFIILDTSFKGAGGKCIFKFYLARVSIPAEITSAWIFPSSFYRGTPLLSTMSAGMHSLRFHLGN